MIDILWEGVIQVCSLEKKKTWKPRTKLMNGTLVQSSFSKLHLEMRVDLAKLVDKRSLPCNEEIDLSDVTFISDRVISKEYQELYFFCQCVRLHQEFEEVIIVHVFKIGNDDVRHKFIDAIFEYMERRVIKQPVNYFKVVIDKQVIVSEGVKLYGNYKLRSSENEIEFMISENIPGIKYDHAEICGAKILEDNRPEVGEHLIDLIIRAHGLNNNYHIVVKSKGGYLLLAYFQRGCGGVLHEIPYNQGGISSFPLVPLTSQPPIPPKPENEAKPPLPPRTASSKATSDFPKMSLHRGDSEELFIPPLPPRQELLNSPVIPSRDIKSLTLPQNSRSNFRQSPPVLPNRNGMKNSRTLPRKARPREPMPLPDQAPQIPATQQHNKPEITPRRGSVDDIMLRHQGAEEPPYAGANFGDIPESVLLSPSTNEPFSTSLEVGSEDSYLMSDYNEFHKQRKPGFYKKQLCPTKLEIPRMDTNNSDLESETPITEIAVDPGYVEIFSGEENLDDAGYLKLKQTELGDADSLGYVTIKNSVGETPKSPERSSSDLVSPVVPPRGYRNAFN